MLILAIALAGALCSAGLALWRPPRMPKYWPLLAIALVPQIASLFGLRIPWMFFAAVAAVLAWCIANWRIPGGPIVALGVGFNLLVMAFHGGAMPIRADVLASIGQAAAAGTALPGSKDIVIESSWLWLLSDWIVIRFGGPVLVVASPGDLILIAGVIWWLLASHQVNKEGAHVNVGRHSDVAGTTYSAATRPK